MMRGSMYFRMGLVLVVVAMVAAACSDSFPDANVAFEQFCVYDNARVMSVAGSGVPEDVEPGGPITNVGGRYVGDVSIDPSELGVDVWEVDPGSAMSVVEQSRGSAVEVWPIYAFGTSRHWTLEEGVAVKSASGDVPDSVFEAADPDIQRPGEPVVGVVDDFDGIHGPFVANLIQLIAPDAEIVAAPVPFVDPAQAEFADPLDWDLPDHQLTDDFAVAAAIRSLQGVAGFVNLSLGTYPCQLAVDGEPLFPIATKTAIDDLRATGMGFVAAAGNDIVDDAGPFFPAALPNVLDVGTASQGGVGLMWDHQTRQELNDPAWATMAPGERLVAMAPDGPYVWTGSSFSAAVTSGLLALGCYPNGSPSPAAVAGLGHEIYELTPNLVWDDGGIQTSQETSCDALHTALGSP